MKIVSGIVDRRIGLWAITCLFLAASVACKKKESAHRAPGKAPARAAKPAKPAAKRVAPKVAHSEPSLLPAPKTPRGSAADLLHGQKVADPYRWLEPDNAPKVKRWLEAHHRRARAFLSALPKRGRLEKRLAELMYVDIVSAPKRKGKRYFFYRRHKDKEKGIVYWRAGERGSAKVLLDPNTWSKDGSAALKGYWIDYQGRRVAFKKSRNNADESVLYLKDVATGKVSTVDVIEGAKYAEPSWTPTGDGYYYTRLPRKGQVPDTERPGYARIYFHRIGESPKKDRLIHEKTGDPTKFIHADLSRDGRFLVVSKYHGWTRSDVFYRDLVKEPVVASHPRSKPLKFHPLAVGHKAIFDVRAHKGMLYIRTDHGAPRYRLFKVDPAKIARAHWKEIVPEQKDAVLRGVTVVGGHLALQYLRNASTELRIVDLSGKLVRQVRFPSIGTASTLVGNPDDDIAYYSFQSYTRPPTIYRTSVKSGASTVYFQLKVPIKPDDFEVRQVRYPSKDGTKVSMFLIGKKGAPRNGEQPTLLYGYGGFNVVLTPKFYSSFFVWAEQGGLVAIPNLRGGGEYGEDWHRAAMKTKKQTTFDDFIAAAEYLIRERYTRPEKLAIRGGSNGGLLVGAVMTQRPDLFRAVSCHVPLLDMIRYHKFSSGKTWISEYGSADTPEEFKAILAYSPYHHVRSGKRYPSLLMFTAMSDDRVHPMHARKFVAEILHAGKSKGPVLLRVERKAGHGGGDMVKKQVQQYADDLGFLMHELGFTGA